MVDVATKKRILVSTEGDPAFPYISLPLDQLSAVEEILRAHHVVYWVDRNAISINGRPFITEVNFGRGTDPVKIQELLDAA